MSINKNPLAETTVAGAAAPFNRWIVVIGGIIVQLCLGAIYAWSAFTKVLIADPYGFTKTQTQIIFAAGLVSFAVVIALIAGRWQARVGPRIVSIASGLVMGLGYVIAGLASSSFWGIFIGVGLIGGAGIGLAYVCPIAALVKWFPDKKRMITGLAVAGFGFGALIWVKLTAGFKFGSYDLTPGWDGLFGSGYSVNEVFIIYGIIFAAAVGLGSLVLINPPENWKPAGYTPPPAIALAKSGGVDFKPGQMVRTVQFWSVFMIFVFGAMAGLMVIGVIKLFGVDQLTAQGMEMSRANVITGTAMGLFYALSNGFGRIVWGSVSDQLGRRKSIALMSLIQGIAMLAFFYVGRCEWGPYLGAALIGFNFGGNFALFPAVTADLFGNRSVGTNYPWVFLVYGIGGIVGPALGGVMGDHHWWLWAFVPAGLLCIVGSVLAMTLKPPAHAREVGESAEPIASPQEHTTIKAA